MRAMFVIEPYVGAGPLRLGATARTHRKAVRDLAERDIRVYYKDTGECEAMEFSDSSRPQPIFLGVRPIGQSYRKMLAWLRKHDPEVIVHWAGLTSLKFGVGFYAPAARQAPQLPVEAVIVFERGYYPPEMLRDMREEAAAPPWKPPHGWTPPRE